MKKFIVEVKNEPCNEVFVATKIEVANPSKINWGKILRITREDGMIITVVYSPNMVRISKIK